MDPVTLGLVGGSMLAGAGSSFLNSQSQASSARKLTKLNYEYGQKSLIASPTHYKEGLELAGINPNFDFAGDAGKGFSAKMLKDQTESNIELQGKQGKAAETNAEANKLQAEAAMKNANTNEKMVTVSGTNAGSKVADTVSGLAKDAALVYTAVKGGKAPATATSAKGAKVKKVPAVVPTPASAGAVSKAGFLPKLGEALTPAILPAALTTAIGSGILMKRAQDEARKNNTKSYQKYGSFTHHASAGW